MKPIPIFALFATTLIAVCLLLFELDLTTLKIQPKPYLNISAHPNPNLDSKTEIPKCPTFPIAKADNVGRLGNQLSTYVNHIALQWEYGKIIARKLKD